MIKKVNKIISVCLSVCIMLMAISISPVEVKAADNVVNVTISGTTTGYDSLQSAYASIGDGDTATITLLDNVNDGGTYNLFANKTITLDLNGYSITSTYIESSGTFNIMTSNPTGTNAIIGINGMMPVIRNDGIMTISNVTINGTNAGYGVCLNNNPTLTLNNAIISGVYGAVICNSSATVTMNGGRLTGIIRGGFVNYNATFNFNSGTVESVNALPFQNWLDSSPWAGYTLPSYKTATISADGKSVIVAPDPVEINGTYNIGTAEELKWFAYQVNNGNSFSGKTINLTADIVLNDTSNWQNWDTSAPANTWTAIGTNNTYPFSGTFDGKGHTVSGIYINKTGTGSSTESYQGLFGWSKGIIQNVGVINSYIKGWLYIGSITGLNDSGTISNCYNTGFISGSNSVGGVTGYNNTNATITNCYNTGTVKGTSITIGGIAGYNNTNATISNSYNTGTVTGTDCVGGIFGNSNNGTITNCYNTGTISGRDYVGGVAGNPQYGTISNCYNTGTTSGRDLVGGIAGRNYNSSIANCYNLSDIIGTNSNVGGVAGANVGGTITNCYYYDDDFGIGSDNNSQTQPTKFSAILDKSNINVGKTATLTYTNPTWNSVNPFGDNFEVTFQSDVASISGTTVTGTTVGTGNINMVIKQPELTSTGFNGAIKTIPVGLTIPLTVSPKSTACDITSFTLGGVVGTISGTNIAVTLPNETDVTSLIPTIEKSADSTIDKTGAQDFTNPVTYKVTAEDGITFKNYIVTVTVEKSTACDITSFTLGSVVGTISGTDISVTLPNGTDVTSLIPTIEKSANSTIDKTGEQDFTSPVTYKVTAEDGTTFKDYRVSVTVYENTKKATTDNIADIVNDLNDGDILTISTTDENKNLSGDILEKIKGKDVDITIDLGNGIEWSFNGKDIPSDWQPKNLNFGVDKNNSNIPVDIINSATGEKRTILANLSYDGEFGFNMTLTMHIGYSDEGKMANLFYYNPQTKKLEFMESSKINSAGNAKFVFTHASDYAIIISDVAITALDTTNNETKAENPKTGENNTVRTISVIVMLSATALSVVSKKRKFKVVKKV